MKNYLLLLLISVHLSPFTSTKLYAQGVKAEISPIEMLIGEQAEVTLSVQAGDGAQVVWPVFKPRQQLVAGVEVVATHVVDSRTMTLTLTSFDGELYHLPPFVVKVDGREVKSGDLALKVVEMEVDTTQLDKIFPPKDVQNPPFEWSEWAPAFWLSVLLLLLMALGYWLYLRLRDNKPVVRSLKIVRRLLPHQKAMREIEQLKAEHLPTDENPKEYYTRLTDTLRRYIEERYGFSAMEMTSSQIIEKLMAVDEQGRDELRHLFETADLVKFAKHSTLLGENDQNLVSAIDFINRTKIEKPAEEEQPKPVLTAEEQRSQKERRTLKFSIWAIASIAAATLIYVCYTLYQLLS